jgi:hypothetical protein
VSDSPRLCSPPASSSNTDPAAEVLRLPLSASSLVSSRDLPTGLTGDALGVAGFALTSANDTAYFVGGQTDDGDKVPLDTIGVWTKNGWTSQVTTGDVPAGRVGASVVIHPSMDLL